MTLNPLTIVRRAFAAAARNGVQDFLQELSTDAPTDAPLTLADLQQRLALPAPQSEEEPVKRKTK